MMKVLAVLVLAVVLVAEAKVVPQQENQQPIDLSAFNELIDQARKNVNDLTKTIQEKLELPDQEAVINNLKTQSNEFANQLQNLMKTVSEEVKARSPEVKKTWEDVKGKLDKAVEDIHAQIPHAKEQAAQLQAKFQEGVQTLIQEADKATKTFSQNSGKVQEDIAKFTKQAVDIAVQTTQNLNQQLQQAAKQ